MSNRPCCPEKIATKRIVVGGQQIGIANLDRILGKAFAAQAASEAELKSILLRELKIYNYVPSSVEGEYLEGIWTEFVMESIWRSK